MSRERISEFHTRRRVEFADTDQGGLVHFARFFVFMETAEHELIRSLGTEVHRTVGDRQIGWPRVNASCRYRTPARFADLLDIAVRVDRIGRRSVTYRFSITRDGEAIADGTLSSVCCELLPGERPRAIDIPPEIGEALEQYGA